MSTEGTANVFSVLQLGDKPMTLSNILFLLELFWKEPGGAGGSTQGVEHLVYQYFQHGFPTLFPIFYPINSPN